MDRLEVPNLPPIIKSRRTTADAGPTQVPLFQSDDSWSTQDPQGIDDSQAQTKFLGEYVKYTELYDTELLNGWRNDLESVLIFAGLFSAVNTAFIIETYKKLQPDPADETTHLLGLLLSHFNSSTAPNDTASTENFQPNVAVNALLFAGLTCSLFAAFGAVLAKQWLYEYSRQGGAPKTSDYDRGIERQRKFSGIERWHFQAVVQSFSTLLQISVLLFLSGLVLFLWSVNQPVACVILGLSGVPVSLYILVTIASANHPDSPFQTPISLSLSGLHWPFASQLPPIREFMPTLFAAISRQLPSPSRLWHLVKSAFSKGPGKDMADLSQDHEFHAFIWVMVNAADMEMVTTTARYIASTLSHNFGPPIATETRLLPKLEEMSRKRCQKIEEHYAVDRALIRIAGDCEAQHDITAQTPDWKGLLRPVVVDNDIYREEMPRPVILGPESKYILAANESMKSVADPDVKNPMGPLLRAMLSPMRSTLAPFAERGEATRIYMEYAESLQEEPAGDEGRSTPPQWTCRLLCSISDRANLAFHDELEDLLCVVFEMRPLPPPSALVDNYLPLALIFLGCPLPDSKNRTLSLSDMFVACLDAIVRLRPPQHEHLKFSKVFLDALRYCIPHLVPKDIQPDAKANPHASGQTSSDLLLGRLFAIIENAWESEANINFDRPDDASELEGDGTTISSQSSLVAYEIICQSPHQVIYDIYYRDDNNYHGRRSDSNVLNRIYKVTKDFLRYASGRSVPRRGSAAYAVEKEFIVNFTLLAGQYRGRVIKEVRGSILTVQLARQALLTAIESIGWSEKAALEPGVALLCTLSPIWSWRERHFIKHQRYYPFVRDHMLPALELSVKKATAGSRESRWRYECTIALCHDSASLEASQVQMLVSIVAALFSFGFEDSSYPMLDSAIACMWNTIRGDNEKTAAFHEASILERFCDGMLLGLTSEKTEEWPGQIERPPPPGVCALVNMHSCAPPTSQEAARKRYEKFISRLESEFKWKLAILQQTGIPESCTGDMDSSKQVMVIKYSSTSAGSHKFNRALEAKSNSAKSLRDSAPPTRTGELTHFVKMSDTTSAMSENEGDVLPSYSALFPTTIDPVSLTHSAFFGNATGSLVGQEQAVDIASDIHAAGGPRSPLPSTTKSDVNSAIMETNGACETFPTLV